MVLQRAVWPEQQRLEINFKICLSTYIIGKENFASLQIPHASSLIAQLLFCKVFFANKRLFILLYLKHQPITEFYKNWVPIVYFLIVVACTHRKRHSCYNFRRVNLHDGRKGMRCNLLSCMPKQIFILFSENLTDFLFNLSSGTTTMFLEYLKSLGGGCSGWIIPCQVLFYHVTAERRFFFYFESDWSTLDLSTSPTYID